MLLNAKDSNLRPVLEQDLNVLLEHLSKVINHVIRCID